MRKKVIDPPEFIKKALQLTIERSYPKLSDLALNLTYDKIKEGFTAEALFYGKGTKPIRAYFEYRYNRTDREHLWRCTHDFND